MPSSDRILIHLGDGLREVVDPNDVFYIEARGDETCVHLPGTRSQLDVRPFNEVLLFFEQFGFLAIHRSYGVNPWKVRQIRRRRRGRDWEVKLEPPLNRVLPVSRNAYPLLLETLQGGELL